MIRILQALISGIALGLGIGSAFFEMWLMSAGCFVATTAGLFLFVRSSLRRTC
jgi:hypothetical protein